MKKHNTQKKQTFKEDLEILYGHKISEQESFDAQYQLAELLRVLDEIEHALPAAKLPTQQTEDASLQGGRLQ